VRQRQEQKYLDRRIQATEIEPLLELVGGLDEVYA
jgi:hypothetical protein